MDFARCNFKWACMFACLVLLLPSQPGFSQPAAVPPRMVAPVSAPSLGSPKLFPQESLGQFMPTMCSFWGYDPARMSVESRENLDSIIQEAENMGITPSLLVELATDKTFVSFAQSLAQQVQTDYQVSDTQDKVLHRLVSREMLLALYAQSGQLEQARLKTLAAGFLKEAKDLFDGKTPSYDDWVADKQGVTEAVDKIQSESKPASVGP